MTMRSKERRRFKANAKKGSTQQNGFYADFSMPNLKPEMANKKVQITLTGEQAMSIFCAHVTILNLLDENFKLPEKMADLIDISSEAFGVFSEQMMLSMGIEPLRDQDEGSKEKNDEQH